MSLGPIKLYFKVNAEDSWLTSHIQTVRISACKTAGTTPCATGSLTYPKSMLVNCFTIAHPWTLAVQLASVEREPVN